MQINKLRKKSKKDLRKELQKKRIELRKLRFDVAAMRLKNNSKLKKTKKDIARILTLINQNK